VYPKYGSEPNSNCVRDFQTGKLQALQCRTYQLQVKGFLDAKIGIFTYRWSMKRWGETNRKDLGSGGRGMPELPNFRPLGIHRQRLSNKLVLKARKKRPKRTTPGIRWSSPTQLLARPSVA
jgi:hypothetical protein